ncbi:MAG TPA: HAMP domain-containing sensor histidine kinase, partial [Spirochaetota bacterium]|nr:HAMP domain-containing sensor histidine kinase [Spirochaetota bacterium]
KNYDFKKINIIKKYDPYIPAIYCYPAELQQVFFNILQNAAHAMCGLQNKPQLIITTGRQKKYVWISIANNGPPIPENIRNNIFDPFFTTKETGAGTGLGLSIAYFIIVNQHNGNIEIKTDRNKNTVFIIKLPCSPAVKN